MTEQATQIVSFPFPKRNPTECIDAREAVFQLKLDAAQMLNDVHAGIYVMSQENQEAIQLVNKLCHQVGLTPLDYQTSE